MRSQKPKKGPPPTRGVQTFWRYTNWSDLWDQWYFSLAENNTYKFKSIRKFAEAVTHNREQRLFLEWYLGPKPESPDEGYKKYKFVEGHPQDWKDKRENHGWYTKSSLRLFSKSITQKTNALEKLAAAGDEITLSAFVGSRELLERLDREFQGRFFVGELSTAQNIARANCYITMRGKLLRQLAESQRLYALSHGINTEDMEGFAHFVAASITLSAGRDEVKKSGTEKMLNSLVQMTLAKSAKHQLPLPEDIDAKILDAVAIDKDKLQ